MVRTRRFFSTNNSCWFPISATLIYSNVISFLERFPVSEPLQCDHNGVSVPFSVSSSNFARAVSYEFFELAVKQLLVDPFIVFYS